MLIRWNLVCSSNYRRQLRLFHIFGILHSIFSKSASLLLWAEFKEMTQGISSSHQEAFPDPEAIQALQSSWNSRIFLGCRFEEIGPGQKNQVSSEFLTFPLPIRPLIRVITEAGIFIFSPWKIKPSGESSPPFTVLRSHPRDEGRPLIAKISEA